MDLANFDFSLRWPKDLFIWEAQRILALHPYSSPSDMVTCLFAEAFVDGQIAIHLERYKYADSRSSVDEAERIVTSLLTNSDILHEYDPPQYWMERQSASAQTTPQVPLSVAFSNLIQDFCELDYFPTIIPKPCVDDRSYQEVDLSKSISRAIGVKVIWPFVTDSSPISDGILFSVMEYFHDHAQRPRTRRLHPYADCGWHYDTHNSESGSAVYRWRVNELLERYQIGLRLGSSGPEKGRMIRHATSELDELADQLVSDSTVSGDEKISEAIRQYRNRSSSVHSRRTAISQLSGYLERHRKKFKANEMTKGDESDIFNIFNNFYIRHDNAKQKHDYGDEYLEWIFWTTLAAIRLLMQLEEREDS